MAANSGTPGGPAAAADDTATGPAAGGGVILRRQAQREAAARPYARSLQMVPVRARRTTLEEAGGCRCPDCLSGAGTLALGHDHPAVLEAIRRIPDSGAPLHVLDLATPLKDEFTTALFETLPEPVQGDAGRSALRLLGARPAAGPRGGHREETSGTCPARRRSSRLRARTGPRSYAVRVADRQRLLPWPARLSRARLLSRHFTALPEPPVAERYGGAPPPYDASRRAPCTRPAFPATAPSRPAEPTRGAPA